MSTINIALHHPIIDIKDHLVFSNNGNVTLCYQINLPEVYTFSEKDFEEIHGCWFQALKSLPIGSVIHKQDVYLKRLFDGTNMPNDTFLAKATHDHFKGRAYMAHHSYIFFTLAKNKQLNNAKYVNPFRTIEKGIHRMLDYEVTEFVNAVNDSVSFLNNSRKLSLVPLKGDQIKRLVSDYFNGFQAESDTDMVLGKTHITIGDAYFDVLAINSESCFGNQLQTSKINEQYTSDDFTFHQGFVDGFGLSLNANHIVNQIIYLDEKQKWRKLLDKKIEELKKSSNFGSQNKVILEKIQHIQAQINTDDQSKIIRGQFNLIYWTEDQDNLKRIASKIKTEFKELDIVPYAPKAEGRKNYILNSFALFSSNFSNDDLYVTDLKHALCLFINNTNYKTDNTGILFNDRQANIPVLKDIWDEQKRRIKARNFAIFAPTGEGKSFLANNILRQFFEQYVRLVIIDLGGSYSKFALLYPQQYTILRYEQGKSLGINPFFISTDSDATPEHLEDLTVFLFELMGLGTKPEKPQSVALKKVLQHYYQAVSGDYSLQNFYRFVDDNKKHLLENLGIHNAYFDVSGFLHILSEYVGDGIYSFLFEADEDQSYKIEDKRLIIFELDEVKDNKELLSVMLKLIKTAIQRTIWRNKKERGIILFDEFAKQLKFENVLESVEFYYQAIRKQQGAIGIILQSINQLPQNATSASILENTQIIYSLRNEKGYEALKNRLSLSSHDHNQLKSIKNNLSGKRKYTEFFIKIGKESNVFRLEVPPEVYAAYLTDGPDNELIMALYKETGSMEEAIKQFLKQAA